MRHLKRNTAFIHGLYAHSDHPAHAKSLIRAFVLHLYSLECSLILLADSEGSDPDCALAQSDLGLRCPRMPLRHVLPWSRPNYNRNHH